MVPNDTERLIAQVEAAFADVPWPGNEDLAADSYGEEPATVRRAFRDRDDWRALDAAFLDEAPEGWGSALAFFSDAAFAFYLPAYLTADLRGELQRADPGFALTWSVEPQAADRRLAKQWGGGTLGEYGRRRFGRFSPAQVRAIVASLWVRLDRDGFEDLTIRHALEAYWLEREARLG